MIPVSRQYQVVLGEEKLPNHYHYGDPRRRRYRPNYFQIGATIIPYAQPKVVGSTVSCNFMLIALCDTLKLHMSSHITVGHIFKFFL